MDKKGCPFEVRRYKGCPFEVRRYRRGDYLCLAEMYHAFYPKGKFQGMPPIEKETCLQWVQQLVENGKNFLAWREGSVIGHVVLLPDFKKRDAEYLIFISHGNRGMGVGTELTRAALEEARKLRIKTIWLTVDAYNFRATRLYKKFQFQFSDAYRSASERMMVIRL
jgi:RimJ/RimL family protein N-acetyltransferase